MIDVNTNEIKAHAKSSSDLFTRRISYHKLELVNSVNRSHKIGGKKHSLIHRCGDVLVRDELDITIASAFSYVLTQTQAEWAMSQLNVRIVVSIYYVYI